MTVSNGLLQEPALALRTRETLPASPRKKDTSGTIMLVLEGIGFVAALAFALLCSTNTGQKPREAPAAENPQDAKSGSSFVQATKPAPESKEPPGSSARIAAVEKPAAKPKPLAPKGFGELSLDMTRRELQTLVAEWGIREWFQSQGPLGGAFHKLPRKKPYIGLAGFQALFTDGQGITADGPMAPVARLKTIHLEFEEQGKDDLENIVKALKDKYGPPVRQGQRQANLLDINPMSQEAIGAFFGNRMRTANVGCQWEWPEADLRLTAIIAVYEKTFLASLSFGQGVLSQERDAAEAATAAKRRAEEEFQARNRGALQSLREERAVVPPKPLKGKIWMFDREVEAGSVVFALGGYFDRGHPSFEIRDAALASIARLPDGVLFQVVAGHESEIPPGGLLVSSKETRRQAEQYFVGLLVKKESIQFKASTDRDYVGIGDIGRNFSRAVRLQPEVICVLTNERAPKYLADERKHLSDVYTKVHVFMWSFPGTFDPGGNAGEPKTWAEFAQTSGGDLRWVQATSRDYFWGDGPLIDITSFDSTQRSDHLHASGQLVYADDEQLVLLVLPQPFSSPYKNFQWKEMKEHEQRVHIRRPVRSTDVPEYQRRFLPKGSIADGSDPLEARGALLLDLGKDGLPPSQEGQMKSLWDIHKSVMTFRNETAQALDLFWLDKKGKRVFYGRIPSKRSWQQSTFATQPWLIADANGVALGIFRATDAAQPIVLRERHKK